MNIREFVKKSIAGSALFALALMQIAFVAAVGGSEAQAQGEGVATQIYDNGPLSTGATARNGTAAPAGSTWSEASYDFGVTTFSNTLAGVGCQVIGTTTANRCADNFNVPVGETWTVNRVIVFGYQTNAATNPFVAANLRIWNGRPGDAGSTIVFGDTTTNRMGTVTDSLMFRIFNSGPPNNTATGTTRRIWRVPIEVSPGLVLTAGNYWVDFQLNGGAGGNFSPTTSITGARGVPGMNARQFIGPPTNTGWGDVFDDGTPVTAPNIPQDFPFKLEGFVAGAPTVPKSRTIDFDGDNKTDLAIARSASSSAQTTWVVSNSGGTSFGMQWGLGTGIGGDVATPADFDGDGKTDVAVWRPDDLGSGKAVFYIFQSLNSTVRADQFGKPGDDATVVGDYDADGKADLATFRTNVAGFDPCGGSAVWFYRRSTVPTEDFTYNCWGTTGDRAYPGDFDGDRRNDFSIVRNSGGSAVHYQRQSTAGDRIVPFGLFTDKFLTGDFDADGRTDFAAVRVNGASFDWYITHSGTSQLFVFPYGASASDLPIPGDYDGDKKTDFAVFRSGTHYLYKTFTSPVITVWGSGTDYPVATSVNAH